MENRHRAGQCAGDEITEITRRPRYSVRPGSRKTISFRLRFSLSVFNGHTADGFRPSDASRFPGHPNLANALVRVRQLRQSYNTYRDVIPVGGTTDVNNRKDSWRTRRKRVGAMDGEMPDELRRRVTSETTPANYSLTLLRSKSVSLWVRVCSSSGPTRFGDFIWPRVAGKVTSPGKGLVSDGPFLGSRVRRFGNICRQCTRDSIKKRVVYPWCIYNVRGGGGPAETRDDKFGRKRYGILTRIVAHRSVRLSSTTSLSAIVWLANEREW